MDKIDKHIQEHRKDFDVEFPNKHKLWENLEQHITADKKVIPLWQRRWIPFAAAACLTGLIVLFVFQHKQQQPTTICSINGVSKEFCMQVNTYETDILDRINTLNATDLSIPKEVESEITLDSPMKVMLLNELKKNPNNPKIQEAILKYYKAKLELVQRIEEVLKKQEKGINNETNNSTLI